MSSFEGEITVAARFSPLSQAQIQEVFQELKRFHSRVLFSPTLVRTWGDLNQSISLREMEKNDFFTREVDQLVLNGTCRIAIHSAKDLPETLPAGLRCVALTAGVDSRDVIVLPENTDFFSLPPQSRIATSSARREEAVRILRQDLTFVDIRGTIEQRLAVLQAGAVEGIVMAEAALIRLQLTRLNRFFLPGNAAPLQGRLAILARQNDEQMRELFLDLHAGF